ncbi:uncharacterized protein BDR25DRAFT_367820 [Lindgomyces ingoldianus]|uniref:Uncharacterized protein n=1 Tax=Lindgomyces ingoldianus TaxID=673940 RepID=A0ACB6QXY1_9PLEO|nr:uncharacterized protein BDR25DRAFT_367820 [Lindgomyces ingoldianus]KAF2471904.1 hypothetical protein BDR25DRAFT_367820 [Lindgomyces ingoldianus]
MSLFMYTSARAISPSDPPVHKEPIRPVAVMPSIKWQTFVQEMLDWHHVATTYLACINYGLTGREERSISYTHLNDWNLRYSSAILPKYDIPSFDFDYDLDWPFVDDGGAINWRWWGCYRGLYPPYLGRLWSQMWFPSTVVQEWPLRDGPVHGRVVGDLLDATRFYPPYMWNHNMKLLRLMFHNTEVVELEDPYSKPDFYFRHTLRPRHRRARSEEWYTSENSPCWVRPNAHWHVTGSPISVDPSLGNWAHGLGSSALVWSEKEGR